MIIDSSALVAIITNEPEAEPMTRSIASAGTRLVSAGNVLEAGIVIEDATAAPDPRHTGGTPVNQQDQE